MRMRNRKPADEEGTSIEIPSLILHMSVMKAGAIMAANREPSKSGSAVCRSAGNNCAKSKTPAVTPWSRVDGAPFHGKGGNAGAAVTRGSAVR
jgi:hypothetical protein